MGRTITQDEPLPNRRHWAGKSFKWVLDPLAPLGKRACKPGDVPLLNWKGLPLGQLLTCTELTQQQGAERVALPLLHLCPHQFLLHRPCRTQNQKPGRSRRSASCNLTLECLPAYVCGGSQGRGGSREIPGPTMAGAQRTQTHSCSNGPAACD